MSSDLPPASPFARIPLRARRGKSSSSCPEPQVVFVDLRGCHRRPANVQDHVSRLFLRRVDAERHLGAPLRIHPLNDLTQPREVLLREVNDAEIEIEFVLRRLASMELRRNRPVEFVVEFRQLIEDLAQDVISRKRLHRVEWRGGTEGHSPVTNGPRIKIRQVDELVRRRTRSRRGARECNRCYRGVPLLSRAAAALAASAANSSRPKAVPASPQPPSAASVSITQVRPAWVGSLETLDTISVISLTSCF